MRTANLALFGTYVVAAVTVGVIWGGRRAAPVRRFLQEGREATADERRAVLQAPLRIAEVVAVLWGGAVVLFGVLNMFFAPELGVNVAITVALGGITTCGVAYLLSERLLRPTAARAMAAGAPDRPGVPGVTARGLIFWALGTGVPLLGLMIVAVTVVGGDDDLSRNRLAVTVLALAGLSLVVGLLVSLLAARATADPIISVRDALSQVERGDLDAAVPVYDATEIGLLQAGFNKMAAGLRERERIRETFGTYVDPAIAEHILSDESAARGMEAEVTLMFLDVRDFTGFAEDAPPQEVVTALNRIFECAVPIVREHEGHVDKFIGDGLLAVFGAPRPSEDHADRALHAALAIERACKALEEGLDVRIGINTGEVVAGSIGGAGRLEFSVIGDAVNVAARIEAATRETGDAILISDRTRSMLPDEHELTERPGIELKGKSEPVTLYAPKLEG